ncbi:TIM barrel protein [Paraglaciecola aquimarina]|uniref:TIM barrel protein n=1 Tax=Paraglaciecola aquimarina TaxID=1235557 RepID=A0ABU3SW17_9ALTE|nr:TIM barrel protein [Paraglaciecola aquimarina]MDU0354191.1 TIM barrel protein [Paraglaciecola aquimarina]
MFHHVKAVMILSVVAVFAACSSGSFDSQKSTQTAVPPISVQLWSVKDFIKSDFKGTLKAIASMGFEGVEFAGEYGPYKHDPVGLKAYLTSIDLKVSGIHVGLGQLRWKNLDKTIDFAKKLGAKMIIIPAATEAWTGEGIDRLIEELTQLTMSLGKHGLVLGYHNHKQEFEDYKDSTFGIT